MADYAVAALLVLTLLYTWDRRTRKTHRTDRSPCNCVRPHPSAGRRSAPQSQRLPRHRRSNPPSSAADPVPACNLIQTASAQSHCPQLAQVLWSEKMRWIKDTQRQEECRCEGTWFYSSRVPPLRDRYRIGAAICIPQLTHPTRA